MLDFLTDDMRRDPYPLYEQSLPAMVIAEMIGIPLADRPRFLRWGEVIMNLRYAISGGGEEVARVKGFQLASAEPWVPRKALHVHGPLRLPIRFEPARQPTPPARG